jgi:SNF2 family DNA or RNA helicase
MKAASKRGATAVLEVKLAEAASRKRTAVLGIIEDHIYSGGKLVVFTGRRKDVDVLGEAVAKSDAAKRKGATVWAAHGERTASERQDIVDEYMAHPGPCVLVGTGDSFGESLNMQDTDAALFVMLPYTPGQLRQWEGRFCRLGQKRPVTIYYVIAEGSVDEHVADILIKKLPAVEKVAQDSELAAARDIIAGMDIGKSDEEFTSDILSKIAASESVTEDDLDLEA